MVWFQAGNLSCRDARWVYRFVAVVYGVSLAYITVCLLREYPDGEV